MGSFLKIQRKIVNKNRWDGLTGFLAIAAIGVLLEITGWDLGLKLYEELAAGPALGMVALGAFGILVWIALQIGGGILLLKYLALLLGTGNFSQEICEHLNNQYSGLSDLEEVYRRKCFVARELGYEERFLPSLSSQEKISALKAELFQLHAEMLFWQAETNARHPLLLAICPLVGKYEAATNSSERADLLAAIEALVGELLARPNETPEQATEPLPA